MERQLVLEEARKEKEEADKNVEEANKLTELEKKSRCSRETDSRYDFSSF